MWPTVYRTGVECSIDCRNIVVPPYAHKLVLRKNFFVDNKDCLEFKFLFPDLPQECFNYHNLTDRKRNHGYKTQATQAWCDSDRKPQRTSADWKGTIHILCQHFHKEGEFINKHFLLIFISTNTPQGMVLEEAPLSKKWYSPPLTRFFKTLTV